MDASPPPLRPLPHRVAPGHGGLRLDRYLQIRFPWHSRAHVQALVRQGAVTGRRPLKASSRLAEGEELTLWLPPGREQESLPPADLPVLFEDGWLLAIDKPAGLLSHPVRFDRKVAAVTEVRRRLLEAGSPVRPTLAHRLDRETSGVLLLAKDPATDAVVKRAFADRRVEKTYHAVVHGVPDWSECTVSAPLGPHPRSPIGIQQAVRPDGAPATTLFRRLETARGFTRIEARPLTGRMHQIRVHLEHLGHPVVGDKIYGRRPEWFLRWLDRGLDAELMAELLLPRHALHASSLEMPHPWGPGLVRIEAPFPQDLRHFLPTEIPLVH